MNRAGETAAVCLSHSGDKFACPRGGWVYCGRRRERELAYIHSYSASSPSCFTGSHRSLYKVTMRPFTRSDCADKSETGKGKPLCSVCNLTAGGRNRRSVRGGIPLRTWPNFTGDREAEITFNLEQHGIQVAMSLFVLLLSYLKFQSCMTLPKVFLLIYDLLPSN